MFVWRSTYDELNKKYKTLVQSELNTDAALRRANEKLTSSEKMLKKAEADKQRLQSNIQGYNEKLKKTETLVAELRKENLEAVDKAESMFASAGGYAGQLSTLKKKVLAVTKIGELRDLQKRIKASEKRKKNAAKK